MITTRDMREWLKTLHTKFNKYYAGKLDTKYEDAVCIYTYKSELGRAMAIGGEETTKTKHAMFTILVHVNKNYCETEEKAYALYENIASARHINVGNYNINYIEMLSDKPVDLHTDESGVYERLIDITVYYN